MGGTPFFALFFHGVAIILAVALASRTLLARAALDFCENSFGDEFVELDSDGTLPS